MARPTLAISARTLITPTGAAAYDNFGASVSAAGDLNGDGYPDVIVGAPFNGSGGTNAGQAYVYFGGPAADAIPDLILTGTTAGEQFGASVSAADVNGDGYADLVVGALGGAPGGAVFVYYGGPTVDGNSDRVFTGEAPGDIFGNSVSAGDVNGDGYADLVVGAPGSDAGGMGSDVGRAYVYYCGPGADAFPDLVLTGQAAGDRFGGSVSAVDANGDGYADVIVGASLHGTISLPAAGRAYVYYGGPGADATADLVLSGEASGDLFGTSVSTAGDFNGDGHPDVIVGAPYNGAGGSRAGRAYIYYGGPGVDATPDLTLTGAAAGDQMGSSVSAAGDVNGDGRSDVIVGAPHNGAAGANAGRAYVYFGGQGADSNADLTFTGAAAGDQFGASVSAAGDMDGDGRADVVVGAPFNDAGGQDAGRAYVFVTATGYVVASPNGGEQWVAGHTATVRWLGNGMADVALSVDAGATWTILASNVGGSEENHAAVDVPTTPTKFARVRICSTGRPVTLNSSDVSDGVFSIVEPQDPPRADALLKLTPTGQAAGDLFGTSVSSAGDVNGDGYSDLIVGAFLNDAGGANAGRAYVYYGGPHADALPDLVLTGETAGDQFGISVGAAGDVNGDGYDDVIVGAWLNDSGGPDAGRAYVYYGGPAADAVPDLVLTGEAAVNDVPGNFGFSVATAGDVNGDGYADVIVGAPGAVAGTGRAYVYYGGPMADTVPDLILSGEQAAGVVPSNFGFSVSTAGDVNGDGYADVIVGANHNDAQAPGAGRAYVYYGGPLADATADLTLTGAAAGDNFGVSVSTAGDVNGDGYADVIVGAYLNDAGGLDAGRAYVYYGGPLVDAVADLTLTGAAPGDWFGGSVSAAGDVNGDGYADLLVAANQNDAGGTNAGRAYVYYGGPGCDAVADLTLSGASSGDQFGASVATAGDVGGDGFSDLIVGAYGNDAGGANAGRAYVFDMNRYHLLSPNGGETWNVGAQREISWTGAEPANVFLSTDGGKSYEVVRSGAGGKPENTVAFLVPHAPTKFARIKLAPSASTLNGQDESDSTFTIQTSVALLALLAAPAPAGAVISWSTDPGPADLSGYRLERSTGPGSTWRILVALTRETSVTDPEAGPGARYRLSAVNGLGEVLWLGETSLRPAVPLAAWPLPYHGGRLSISFATFGGLGGGVGLTEVAVFDVSGRLVRTVTRGAYPAGYQSAVWDGCDDRGGRVPAGVYFLRSRGAGDERSIKITVLR